MLTLDGKGAIVIGTRRIGDLIARRLAAEGVNLAIVYRSSKAEAEHLYQSLLPVTERVSLIQGDVGVEEDVKRIVHEASQELGGLSFVINLASGFPRTPFAALDANAWEASMAAAKGSYLLAVHGARSMMERKVGGLSV